MMTASGAQPLSAAVQGSGATLEALADTLASESRLLCDLETSLRKQREAVATDDLQGMEEAVYATHRILMTLSEARRRRRSLDEVLSTRGTVLPADLLATRERLREAAHSLAAEVDALRQILHEALASGEEQIRTLYGGAEPRAFYPGNATPAPAPGVEGSLFNRRA
jgi:hypothetical protein